MGARLAKNNNKGVNPQVDRRVCLQFDTRACVQFDTRACLQFDTRSCLQFDKRACLLTDVLLEPKHSLTRNKSASHMQPKYR